MNDNFLGAEFREVGERLHLGKSARVVSASRVFLTTQDDLWDALTNKERLPRWFAPVEGDLKLGGHYKIKDNAKGEITLCEVPHALELTWVIFFNTSWVHVRLTAEEGGTRLTLEHLMRKGFMAERHWRKYGPGATGAGWDIAFLSIGQHVEGSGAEIDPKAQEARLATDEGKAFLRDCAKSWGQSHIESGARPQIANASAEETAKFYTGD